MLSAKAAVRSNTWSWILRTLGAAHGIGCDVLACGRAARLAQVLQKGVISNTTTPSRLQVGRNGSE